MNTFRQHRDREVTVLTALIGAVCTLAVVGTLAPAVENAVNRALTGLAVLAVLALGARWGLRWRRERREDRADAVTAAAWRAAQCPPGGVSTVEGSPGGDPRAGVA